MTDDPRYVDVPNPNDPYADRSGVEGDIRSVSERDPADDSTRLDPANIDSTRQVENPDNSTRFAPDADARFVPDPNARTDDPAFVNNENKNDGRIAPDANADVAPFVRRDDFLDRGYLSEGDARAALGIENDDDDVPAGYAIMPEGTAFRIVEVKDEA